MSEIKDCGCYDGVWAPDDPSDVSIRCAAHTVDPGFRDGALPMTVEEARISLIPSTRRGLEKGWLKPKPKPRPVIEGKAMAVPKSRVRHRPTF